MNVKNRESARERARLMREAEARRQRQRRIALISSAVVVLLVIAAGVAVAITTARGSSTAATGRPPGITADDGIMTGSASAPHVVALYEDYQCPYCKAFTTSVGPWLEQQRAAGTTRIEYRVVSFLDRSSSGTKYSTRAANAAACLAGQSGADYTKFNDALYAQQPPEGDTGLPDATLIKVAESAGAGASVANCIDSQKYADWVQTASSDATDKHQVTGTPTVLVDGKLVQGPNGTQPTQAQIAQALGVAS